MGSLPVTADITDFPRRGSTDHCGALGVDQLVRMAFAAFARIMVGLMADHSFADDSALAVHLELDSSAAVSTGASDFVSIWRYVVQVAQIFSTGGDVCQIDFSSQHRRLITHSGDNITGRSNDG